MENVNGKKLLVIPFLYYYYYYYYYYTCNTSFIRDLQAWEPTPAKSYWEKLMVKS